MLGVVGGYQQRLGGDVQFAKDSFYVALRERLAETNPERNVAVNGMVRPAIVVEENEAGDLSAMDNTFRIGWGECASAGDGSGLMKIACTIAYATEGNDGTSGDRGRALGALDGELMRISRPPRAAKKNYTMVPPAPLGTYVFWSDLEFGLPKDEAGRLSRMASTTVYFVSEVNA